MSAAKMNLMFEIRGNSILRDGYHGKIDLELQFLYDLL